MENKLTAYEFQKLASENPQLAESIAIRTLEKVAEDQESNFDILKRVIRPEDIGIMGGGILGSFLASKAYPNEFRVGAQLLGTTGSALIGGQLAKKLEALKYQQEGKEVPEEHPNHKVFKASILGSLAGWGALRSMTLGNPYPEQLLAVLAGSSLGSEVGESIGKKLYQEKKQVDLLQQTASFKSIILEKLANATAEELAKQQQIGMGALGGSVAAVSANAAIGTDLMNSLDKMESAGAVDYIKTQAKNMGLKDVAVKEGVNDLGSFSLSGSKNLEKIVNTLKQKDILQMQIEAATKEGVKSGEMSKILRDGLVVVGDKSHGVGLHELYHQKNHKMPVAKYWFKSRMLPATALTPLILSPQLREGVVKATKGNEKIQKTMDWVKNNPEATFGIGASGMLADEGLASLRALKHLKKTNPELLKQNRKLLGKAFGTYGAMVGAGALATGGISRLISSTQESEKQRQELLKKKREQAIQNKGE